MRKLLIGIIIIALSILLWNIVVNEVSAFGINVLGYQKIKDLNSEIDIKLEEATMLTSRTYAEKYKELENSAKSLATVKKEYQEKTANISASDIQRANQLNSYEIEFLWARVGKYATSNNIILKLDIANTATGITGNKDLLFTANGEYWKIVKFISSLEDDEKLAFKIEEFRLIPGVADTSTNETTGEQTSNANQLQATFKVTDIDINIDNITESAVEPIETEPKPGATNKTTADNTVKTENTVNTQKTPENVV